MTKIVLKVKKDVDADQAEALRFVIKRAVADYYCRHVPVEKSVKTSLRVTDPEKWHSEMVVAERNADVCHMLMLIKTDDIEVKVTP